MYTWKINMKNGDSHIVKSDIKNSTEFMNFLMGTNAAGINISHLPLEVDRYYEYDVHRYNSNWIAIISTDVSSVEWLSK